MTNLLTLKHWLVTTVLIGSAAQALFADGQQGDRSASTNIAKTELAFRDVAIQPSLQDGYVFAGRIENRSKRYSLRSVAIRLVFYDCADRSDTSTCGVIGERHETIYVTIAPGQEETFKEPIYVFGDLLKVKGEFVWRYEVLSIKAGR